MDWLLEEARAETRAARRHSLPMEGRGVSDDVEARMRWIRQSPLASAKSLAEASSKASERIICRSKACWRVLAPIFEPSILLSFS